MTRLLAAAALVAALAVVAGSRTPGPTETHLSWLCRSEPDAGTKPRPHGLLMVADREPGLPCAQGG